MLTANTFRQRKCGVWRQLGAFRSLHFMVHSDFVAEAFRYAMAFYEDVCGLARPSSAAFSVDGRLIAVRSTALISSPLFFLLALAFRLRLADGRTRPACLTGRPHAMPRYGSHVRRDGY